MIERVHAMCSPSPNDQANWILPDRWLAMKPCRRYPDLARLERQYQFMASLLAEDADPLETSSSKLNAALAISRNNYRITLIEAIMAYIQTDGALDRR